MLIRPLFSRCAAKRALFAPALARQTSTKAVDEFGIPVNATWSVKKLLSTYPAPTLSHGTLARLHQLSALEPPEPSSPKAESLRLELQELLRLVEAVKLVDTSTLSGGEDIPDSRIWAEGRGIDLDGPEARHLDEAHGRALLRHASKHIDGQYVVETAPRARSTRVAREG
ncbi:hypothetical protein FS749_011191 [Ceratobasidium sp. UAMH 11750]|nr:hypothetical protein FS749_011191 [Ceratobasidium sp. UAMH 11750]